MIAFYYFVEDFCLYQLRNIVVPSRWKRFNFFKMFLIIGWTAVASSVKIIILNNWLDVFNWNTHENKKKWFFMKKTKINKKKNTCIDLPIVRRTYLLFDQINWMKKEIFMVSGGLYNALLIDLLRIRRSLEHNIV